MSIENVDIFHKRISEALDDLGLKKSEAARRMGEESSQGLRDVCSGRKRASVELLAKLALIGVDSQYVLTGKKSDRAKSPDLPADEQLLLDSYRALPVTKRRGLLAELITGGKPLKAKPSTTANEGVNVTVTGSGNRAAGRDYNENK